MGKPTAEELKEALAEAARMREQGQDEHHIAKALLNCHFLLQHADRVYHATEEYLRSGLDQSEHKHLLKALEEYRTAETHPMLLHEDTF